MDPGYDPREHDLWLQERAGCFDEDDRGEEPDDDFARELRDSEAQAARSEQTGAGTAEKRESDAL